ncbi:MarR family winged helix-turn-helix transcriptional regulator [Jidongwangia harbinensis]|uniref:MarR family winged helix-turn-helix transcriptional regulator n=1 Tax=Jidongwangia harbinensis TaxID=2878561 RepID=UPI001CDA1015|nr:MarR family transcriptional regulator [Jidongwangia harbinensis]MCA2214275.1 MarR family transcriptional regulator [Jidongwangia harbinensis]
MDDEGLAELFWGVSRRLRARTRTALEPFGVAPAQARALGVLLGHGPLRLSELAERLRIAPRSATEVVDDLQQRHLVVRRPDPADRRATLVDLTPAGTAAGQAIRDARRAESARFFGALSAADRADLGRVLRQLRD